MTVDPGRPFSKPYQDVIEALEDRIRYGVEQPDTARYVFKNSVSTYELPRPAYAIVRVTGLVDTEFTLFTPVVDYRFSNNRIIWMNRNHKPNDGSRMEIDYTYRERPAGLTDFNPGSVVGTLVRAMAREMKLIYEQMDEAYRRAFIDQATGAALDNVVALLGVVRNPPTHAEGFVTFYRNTPTDKELTIPIGTEITDDSGRVFVTTAAATLPIEMDEFKIPRSGQLQTANQIGAIVGIWPEALVNSNDLIAKNSLKTKDAAPKLPFGEDKRTIRLSTSKIPEGRLRIRYKPASVIVPVQAADPGPNGNVNAQTITIMPTPPPGVEGVINEQPIAGGHEAEDDNQLRERAKHALERSGNATLNAIKFAVLDVDGVEAVEVMDHTVDDSIPVGEVRVRFSGGDVGEVERVVQETRAAGILARLETIQKTMVYGTVLLIPAAGIADANLGVAGATFREIVLTAIEALNVGEPLSVRRLISRVFEVDGLGDVAEAQLLKSTDDPNKSLFDDTLLVDKAELLRPDEDNLVVSLLRSLGVSGVKKSGKSYDISLQLLDSNQAPARFGNFSLDVNVTLRATSSKGQGVERINNFTRRVTFSESNTATLTIAAADYAAFRADDHEPDVEVALTSAAYAGLQGVKTTITI